MRSTGDETLSEIRVSLLGSEKTKDVTNHVVVFVDQSQFGASAVNTKGKDLLCDWAYLAYHTTLLIEI